MLVQQCIFLKQFFHTNKASGLDAMPNRKTPILYWLLYLSYRPVISGKALRCSNYKKGRKTTAPFFCYLTSIYVTSSTNHLISYGFNVYALFEESDSN